MQPFGKTSRGQAVEVYTLSNANGMAVDILTYGGVISAIRVPDRNGVMANVTLGFDNFPDYEARSPHFGCITGRYANRIAGASFRLGGREIRLSANEKGNHLHGGERGFSRRVWQSEAFETKATLGVRFQYRSADGEEGYPGALDAAVIYTLGAAGRLRIDYRATSDRTTVVNLTHHSYFNLRDGGASRILPHRIQIEADAYLAVDQAGIPTGEARPVAGTPLDFRRLSELGARIESLVPERGGYDHCFVLRERRRDGEPSLAARVYEPESGRVLELSTTQPGLQLYTGNSLDGGFRGRGGAVYGRWQALCLEPQDFPDAPNQPGFPSSTLEPGREYAHSTVFRFGVEG